MAELENGKLRVLMVEAHRIIEQEAARIADALGDGLIPEALSYPPEETTPQVEGRMSSLKLDAEQAEAMRRLVADACASAFFQWLNLLDATGDPELAPEVQPWLGARLEEPNEDEDAEMLHDLFYETWWEYVERRDA